MSALLRYNLKAYRLVCDLSQQQVADALGIDRSTYSYYELGKTQPQPQMLVRLARLFGVTVDTLLQEDGMSFEDNTPFNYFGVQTPSVNQLKKSEQDMILLYRQMSASDQQKLMETAKDLLEKALEK